MIGSPSFGVWFCNNKSKSTVESTFDDAKVGCDFAIEKSKSIAFPIAKQNTSETF